MKQKILTMTFITLITLAGCSGGSIEEKLYSNLEKTVEIEEGTMKPAAKLNELEIENEELFKEIIGFSEEELQGISEKVDTAIKINEERKKELDEEAQAISKAKNEFGTTKKLISKLKKDDVQKIAEEMYVVMNERYNAYDSLYAEYDKSIDSTIKVYNVLKESDVSEDSLIKLIESINNHNQKIIDLNEIFNEKTETYNLLKKELYKKINLNIKFSEKE